MKTLFLIQPHFRHLLCFQKQWDVQQNRNLAQHHGNTWVQMEKELKLKMKTEERKRKREEKERLELEEEMRLLEEATRPDK